jgi:hypothetical protein
VITLVHVNRPPQGVTGRRVLLCPTCKRRRRFVQSFMGAYYSDHVTCCGCGDSWCEGLRLERPFSRGWRRQAASAAKAKWDGALSPTEFRRRVREAVEAS